MLFINNDSLIVDAFESHFNTSKIDKSIAFLKLNRNTNIKNVLKTINLFRQQKRVSIEEYVIQ
jgi:pyoverdine/dityrosine biosynthesis protein Dit1